ncbi:DUF7501 family protein [Halopiger thermotolerans]
MSRADSTPVENAVLAMKQTNPDASVSELASRIGCSIERVEEILEEYEHDRVDLETEVLEPREPAEWDDPTECPFCGASIDDGGAGFIEHVERKNDCAVAFSRWREGVSSDVEGEWVA